MRYDQFQLRALAPPQSASKRKAANNSMNACNQNCLKGMLRQCSGLCIDHQPGEGAGGDGGTLPCLTRVIVTLAVLSVKSEEGQSLTY